MKYVWLWTALFCVFALIATIPAEKYQRILRHYVMKKRYAPQVRADVTQRYLDAVESGEISDVYLFGYAPEYIRMYEAELDARYSVRTLLAPPPPPPSVLPVRKYSRPLYIRDKNNPEILYPYPAEN